MQKKLLDFFASSITDESYIIASLLLSTLSEAQKQRLLVAIDSDTPVRISTNKSDGYHHYVINISMNENDTMHQPSQGEESIMIRMCKTAPGEYSAIVKIND
jgi:sensor histidine kinase regulating citrate/malate metabolism